MDELDNPYRDRQSILSHGTVGSFNLETNEKYQKALQLKQRRYLSIGLTFVLMSAILFSFVGLFIKWSKSVGK